MFQSAHSGGVDDTISGIQGRNDGQNFPMLLSLRVWLETALVPRSELDIYFTRFYLK